MPGQPPRDVSDAVVQGGSLRASDFRTPARSTSGMCFSIRSAVSLTIARSATADLAANERALRLLCIRAEMLTSVATPPEDQALRRNYQLERLVTGTQHTAASASAREQLDALLFDWVGVCATPDAVYDELLARMQQCRGAAAGRECDP